MSIINYLYAGKDINFDISEQNIKVNATEIAKIFGKDLFQFTKSEHAKLFITECLKPANAGILGIENENDLITSLMEKLQAKNDRQKQKQIILELYAGHSEIEKYFEIDLRERSAHRRHLKHKHSRSHEKGNKHLRQKSNLLYQQFNSYHYLSIYASRRY